MPCTAKKTFACATATGNALLVRVKDNQPRLRDALVALCAERDPVDRLEKVHPRRAGPGRPARDGRPRPARPSGAPACRGLRGGRPPRPGLAAVDRLRGPG